MAQRDASSKRQAPDLDEQVRTYETVRPTYELFTRKLKDLLDTLVEAAGIQIHVIEARSKEPMSVREKLQRPGKSYPLGFIELTDLCGCRVITHYSDECIKIGDLI